MALEVGEDLDGLAAYIACLLDVHGDVQLGMSLVQAQGDDGAEKGIGKPLRASPPWPKSLTSKPTVGGAEVEVATVRDACTRCQQRYGVLLAVARDVIGGAYTEA